MAKQKYMRSLKKPYTHMKRQREKKVILLKFFYWSMANVQYCVSFRCTRSDIQREMVPWPVTYVFYILVLNQLKTKEGKSPFETFVADPVLVSIFSRLKLKLNHSVENDLVVVWSPIIWKQKWKQTSEAASRLAENISCRLPQIPIHRFRAKAHFLELGCFSVW